MLGGSAGTSGYVLQTTGAGVQWVATSSLGIVGGGGGGGTWGSITGTLSAQTDLQNTLDLKMGSFATGTSAQYLKGDLTLGTFPTTTSAFFNDSGFATGTPWTTMVCYRHTLDFRWFTLREHPGPAKDM